MKTIALFGIFRSGTNFTRTVLEWNYHCQLVTDVFGWKHGFYPIIVERSRMEYPPTDMLFVTKNPFSSIYSLYNYYQTNGRNILAAGDWKHFLRQRFVTYDFFQERSPQYRFANVVDFWNSMNWNFASVQRPDISTLHVRYEDMLSTTLETAESAARKLALEKKFSSPSRFRIPTRVTRNMGDKPRQDERDYLTDRPFDKKTYAEKSYYRLFDKDDIAFVLNNVDIDLARHLGYEPELEYAKNRII